MPTTFEMDESAYWRQVCYFYERFLSGIFAFVPLYCAECGERCNHFDHYYIHTVLRHVVRLDKES